MKARNLLALASCIFFYSANAQVITANTLNNEGYRLLQEGKIKEAISFFGRAISQDSTQSVFYHNRGYANYQIERYAKAEWDLLKAAKLNPGDPELTHLLAINYHKRGNYQKAVEAYSLILESDPKNISALNGRSTSYIQSKQYSGALSDLDLLLKLDPKSESSYHNRGFVRYQLRDKNGACNDWKKAETMGFRPSKQYHEKYCN